jgi:hypothetical protein
MTRQLGDGPLVRAAFDGDRPAASGSCTADLAQEMSHHRRIERVASLGWPPSFLIECLRDRGVVMPSPMQFDGASDQIVIGAELVEAGNRSDQLMRGSMSAVPMAGHANQLRIVNNFNQHALQQQANECLALFLSCS